MVAKDSNIIHGSNGEGSTGAVDHEVHRVTSAVRIPQDLAKDVIEDVVKTANLKSAFKAVKRNKGAPGIDKRTINEVQESLDEMCAGHDVRAKGSSPIWADIERSIS